MRFADDILQESVERLRESAYILDAAGRNGGLKINVEKTKAMAFGSKYIDSQIITENRLIENVREYIYHKHINVRQRLY